MAVTLRSWKSIEHIIIKGAQMYDILRDKNWTFVFQSKMYDDDIYIYDSFTQQYEINEHYKSQCKIHFEKVFNKLVERFYKEYDLLPYPYYFNHLWAQFICHVSKVNPHVINKKMCDCGFECDCNYDCDFDCRCDCSCHPNSV